MTELDKAYDHTKVEEKIYKLWESRGYFNPDKLPDAEKREPFTISLPPPNVTGTLHLGHAFEDAMQDMVIRYQRMLGKKTLWVPGHRPRPHCDRIKSRQNDGKKRRKTKTGL